MINKLHIILFSAWMLNFLPLNSQHDHMHDHNEEALFPAYLFKENKGQWHPNCEFKVDLQQGALFLEKTGLTYHFVDRSFISELHVGTRKKFPKKIKAHGLKMKFKGANKNPSISKKHASISYENYFIGNDSSKWASNVRAYHELYYQNVYDNIDFSIYEQDGNLKYDFIIQPSGDPTKIILDYEGADKLKIKHGMLVVKTSISDVIEQKPVAYQEIDGQKVTVSCNFVLNRNEVSFEFPEGYDKNHPLIIDPILIFSTYTGSTANNFGSTATYDIDGNTYAAGTIFGTGYPTTSGAYDVTFNGSGTSIYGLAHPDVGISKFNANGGALIYSTYIGGSLAETPQSLVVNDNYELYIFGSTGSSNFPTTAGAYDGTFNGGGNIGIAGAAIEHPNGTDIFISKLNATGTTMLSSTYVGGSGDDGTLNPSGLTMNYGDWFRGEIIVDNNDNCYISTSSTSSNFPVTDGSSLAGNVDAVFFKMNANLSNILWGTYFGSTGSESGYGIQLDGSNNIFVTGGSTSVSLPSASTSGNGGVDGYIAKYDPNGSLLTSRHIGTGAYDQTFLIQVDIYDDVYVVGQSRGSMPVTPGKYNNPNSGQFIQKFDNTITTMEWSTVFGRSSGNIDISLTAFLVNDCGLVYVCGWGGSSNTGNIPTSTTSGLPVTNDAFQATTDGDDFYLMVLSRDAQNLLYGTFFGGGTSSEHVDGGTSRFDKDGNVYQAVCAGCGGNSDFPTTAGVWSNTNNSTGCNLAIFKFNVEIVYAIASTPQAFYCWPAPVTFDNQSNGGNTYFWDFGDGNTSTDFEPTHAYASGGTYQVKLVVSDSTGCVLPDSNTITIELYNPIQAQVTPTTFICPNETIQLNASGGTSYLWSPANSLSDATIANPVASPGTTNTTYQVIVSDQCGADTAEVTIGIFDITTSATADTIVCLGDTVPITATGGGTYTWSPANFVTQPNNGSTGAFPNQSTQYYVSIITPDGCPTMDSVYIAVDQTLPINTLTNDTAMCNGESMPLLAGGARSYLWNPSSTLDTNAGNNVIATPQQTTTYSVDFTNACGTVTDNVTVEIIKPTAIASPPLTICYNDTFLLTASGGVGYNWFPKNNLASPLNDSTLGFPYQPQEYYVIVTDSLGCTDTANTSISYFPIPTIDAGEDKIIIYGQDVTLGATHSGGSFFWDSSAYLNCLSCENTAAFPEATTTFYANILDHYGCIARDSVTISLDGVIYVPNSFTPDGDGVNDVFKVNALDLTKFEMSIYNRWGQLIFETEDIAVGWNGNFKGEKVKMDTYVWKITYSDVNSTNQKLIGHVNVIR